MQFAPAATPTHDPRAARASWRPPTAFPGASLAGFLLGAWALERVIHDRLLGVRGVASGRVEFSPTAEGLSQHESGVLDFAGSRVAFTRRYRWRFATAHAALVCFDDGRVFHPIDDTRAHARATHPCGADRYRGLFAFDAPERWRSAWLVRGPRKRLRLVSRYTRVHG